MTERSPISKLLGIEMVEETADRAVARLEIRDEHKTPTGVVHSGTILSLADDCATRAQPPTTKGRIRVRSWCWWICIPRCLAISRKAY